MKKCFFVQFKWINKAVPGSDFTCLGNGFSNTYYLCKNVGDIIWVDYEKMNLPDNADVLYISVLFHYQIVSCLDWALNHPKTKVVIGGPGTLLDGYRFNREFPDNVIVTRQTVEEAIFGKKDLCYSWNLDLPSDAEKYMVSYTVDKECYWCKCKFCSTIKASNKSFKRGLNNLIIPKDIDKFGVIFLVSPCLSSEFIDDEFKNLQLYNGIYQGSVRADNDVISSLDSSLRLINRTKLGNAMIKLNFGVEYPSNRMLSLMKKGVTTSSLLKLIEVLIKHKCLYDFNIIQNWEIGRAHV